MAAGFLAAPEFNHVTVHFGLEALVDQRCAAIINDIGQLVLPDFFPTNLDIFISFDTIYISNTTT